MRYYFKKSWFYHSFFGKMNCARLLLWNLKGKINSGKMWIILDLQTEMWRCWEQVLECKRMNWKLRLLIKALNQKSKHVRTWTRPDRDLIRNIASKPSPRLPRGLDADAAWGSRLSDVRQLPSQSEFYWSRPLIRGSVHLPDPEPDATEAHGRLGGQTTWPGRGEPR